jgi:hypothetical protein
VEQINLFQAETRPTAARRAFGLAWYSGTAQSGRGAGFRPFQAWRRIERGRHAGMVEVTFCSGRVRKLREDQIRSWPDLPRQTQKQTAKGDRA